MRAIPTSPAAALQRRVALVLNTASGGYTARAVEEAQTIFAAAGLPQAEVTAVGPAEMTPALEAVSQQAGVLAVLGGDGTIRAAAERCAGRPTWLIPLPGGTMNMLPKALYGERSWQAALSDTLAAPRPQPVSGGLANGRAFFVAALFGAPTLWADAREAIREVRLGKAAKRAVTAARRSFSNPLRYRFGAVLEGAAEAVAVICPMISKALDGTEPMLEAAAVDPAGAADALRLGFHALFDDWRLDPAVRRAKVHSVLVLGHGRVPAILDGEKARLGRRVEVTFRTDAFTALAPAA